MSNSKHSAYRSMRIAEKGKAKTKGGLRTWIDEKWINLSPYAYGVVPFNKSPECGDSSLNPKGVPSVCRPMKKKSKNTPTLANNYTKAQIRKAVEMKKKGKRIMWGEL